MGIEDDYPLPIDELIDALNGLAHACNDSQRSLTACAAALQSGSAAIFFERAQQCSQAERRLVELVASLGGQTENGGSGLGALRRGWTDVKDVVGAADDATFLEECEQCELAALQKYRDLRAKQLHGDIRAVLEQHIQQIEHGLRIIQEQKMQ